MSSEPTPRGHARIDATEVSQVDITDDGLRLSLRLRDREGQHASVSLPIGCLNTLLTAVPRSASDLVASHDAIHLLDGWSLDRTDDGLLLTLRLPDGAHITFAVKPWQIAAMASLAGQDSGAGCRRLN
jgi:hypothetical protein